MVKKGAEMKIDPALASQLDLLGRELDRRIPVNDKLDRYHAGYPDTPEHVKEIKAETEYRLLLRQAVTNWPKLIVDSTEERLEVTGFEFPSGSDAEKDAWRLWNLAEMESRAREIKESTLTDGRAFVIVWPGAGQGEVTIVGEHANTVVVSYDPQTGEPMYAMRRWEDNGKWYANLFTRQSLFKFECDSRPVEGEDWRQRLVDGEEWPLVNPLAPLFPVVEFTVNSNLAGFSTVSSPTGQPRRVPRIFGSAYGEFERELPVVDRINTTVFAGLLGQAFASFPVRAMIGDPINYVPVLDSNGDPVLDTAGNPVMEPSEPFKAAVNRFIQIENPDGKLIHLPQSGLEHYIKFAEAHIRHLAAVTKAPSYYLLGEMVNVSADAIRAAEAGLISKVRKHQRGLGPSWARVIRLAMLASTGEDPGPCRTQWKNPESRSLAESADAASKLADILPWQALAERILNATPSEVSKWEAERATEALNTAPLQ